MGKSGSLRARLTLVLLLVNAVVLGALAWWVGLDEDQRELARLRRSKLLEESLRERLLDLEPEDAGDVAGVLRSPLWREFEDAVLIDQRRLDFAEATRPTGAFLNPLGNRHRAPDFPLDEIVRALSEAVGGNETRRVAGGLAMPLVTSRPLTGELQLWGGVFVRPRPETAPPPLALRVLFFAVAATVLGAGLIYLLVGRAVLRPVERLARAAHEFGAGGRPELPARGGAREVDELLVSFRAMMERIHGFRAELEREVELATQRAAQAERRASRQERLAAMGTLAAGLAHEINSPLAGALAGLEVLRRDAAGARAERYGGLVQEALQRIASLVQRLLRLAPARIEPGLCRVGDAARDLPDFLAARLGRHRLLLDFPSEPLHVQAAVGDLFPVLLNLVQNSLDALDGQTPPRAGTIVVRARPLDAQRVLLLVEDDGPGVAPELLAHLFEPFVTTKEAGAGTGLGLALAQATIRQLGGRIEAVERPGGGLAVRIELPRGGPA